MTGSIFSLNARRSHTRNDTARYRQHGTVHTQQWHGRLDSVSGQMSTGQVVLIQLINSLIIITY